MTAPDKLLPTQRYCYSCASFQPPEAFPPKRAKGKQWRCTACKSAARERRLTKRF